jgi:hypothetical protein
MLCLNGELNSILFDWPEPRGSYMNHLLSQTATQVRHNNTTALHDAAPTTPLPRVLSALRDAAFARARLVLRGDQPPVLEMAAKVRGRADAGQRMKKGLVFSI